MKLKKKLIISTALLAVVGGLAGCGNQASQSQKPAKQTTQQNAQSANKPSSQQNTYAELMDADNSLPAKDHKYTNGVQPQDNALCVTIKQPTKAVPFKDGTQDANEPIAQKPGYSLNKQVNSYWHDLHNGLVKRHATHGQSLPVVFLFEYNTGKNDGNIYEVAYASTKSAKLHNDHMKLIKSASHDPNEALD